MSALENASVRRVQSALAAAGSPARITALAETARTAQDAADAVGSALGSIVKSLVFVVGDRPVIALVAGDRQCDPAQLPAVLGLDGKARRAKAEEVREATGFAIGGVAPLGYPQPLPVVIDASLARFETIYAAAGHPYCIFATDLTELCRITGGQISDRIAIPLPARISHQEP